MKIQIKRDRKTNQAVLIITNPPQTKPIYEQHNVITISAARELWTGLGESDFKPSVWSNCLMIPDNWGNKITLVRCSAGLNIAGKHQITKTKQWLTSWLKTSKEEQ
jgi:hypothetical protein